MSLNWNIEKVKDYKKFTEGDEWAVTDALIWATMTVGYGNITAANAEEFYKRVHLQELVHGTWLRKDGKPHYITQADITARIGLHTNAGDFSRAEFNKRVLRNYWR